MSKSAVRKRGGETAPNTENETVVAFPTRTGTNEDRPRREYLTEKEVDQLCDAARARGRWGHRDATMIMVAFRHGEALIICCAIFEVARYVLLMLYLKELGKICKEREATSRTTMLLVALPSALVGSLLVALLGIELLKEAMPSRTFAQIFLLLYAIAKLGAYSFIYLMTMKTANDISDAAYKMY